MAEITSSGAPPNPYEAPSADPGSVEPVFDITWEEVHAYVGEGRSHYYWTRWHRALLEGSKLAGFNWGAAFFNVLWLMYRRMYREFFVAVGILMAVGALLDVLGSETGSAVGTVDRITNYAFMAIMGIVGNGLYMRRARLVIAAARREESDEERRAELLRRRGGTRILWALIAAFCFLALNGLALSGALDE